MDASIRGSRGFFADIDRDLLAGIRAWRLWTMLGWNDIRQRYRRSVLGPFWITISMAVFITLLGEIYSHIFKIELKTYLPYLSLGYIIWGFVATTTSESFVSFQESERVIRQIRLPYSIYVFRVVWRNFIVFLHTIVIFVPVAVIFDVRPGFTGLLALPGLALVYINQAWLTLSLGIICTRYRDVQQIVSTGDSNHAVCNAHHVAGQRTRSRGHRRSPQPAVPYDRVGPRSDARQCSVGAVLARRDRLRNRRVDGRNAASASRIAAAGFLALTRRNLHRGCNCAPERIDPDSDL